MLVIGVDPGTNTGLGVWDTVDRKFLNVESANILEAIRRVRMWRPDLVIFEDARKRGRFDKMDAEQKKYGAAVREGAGSVKRDCAIWEEFLEEAQIPYQAKAPRSTKKDAAELAFLYGWTKRSNEHARDAAFIVAGLNTPMAEGIVQAWAQSRPSEKEIKASSQKGDRSAGTHAPSSSTVDAA